MSARRPLVFIHVPGFENMGWVADPEPRARLFAAIERAGYDLELWEVGDAEALRRRLAEAPAGARFWPNAYRIPAAPPAAGEAAAAIGLVDLLESADRSVIGSGGDALRTMRDKVATQRALAAAGVPIPDYAVITPGTPPAAARELLAGLTAPVLVKPTTGQGSCGIDRDSRCDDLDTAAERASAAAEADGEPMLVESFLPGADLTFGIIGDADGHRLMITYYLVADRPPATTPLDRRSRLLPWGDGKSMVVVDDPALRRQVAALAPTICAAIGVRDVTRVDGRVDHRGTLRIFDVNGMPALVFPEGVIVAQALACDPERPADAVFDGLVAGILDAAERRFATSR